MTAQGSFSLVPEVLSGVAPAEQDESRMNFWISGAGSVSALPECWI